MNRNTFLKAVDMIDDSLIAKSMRPQKKRSSDVLFYLIGAAALILVILSTSLMFSKQNNTADPSGPDVTVSEHETEESSDHSIETTAQKMIGEDYWKTSPAVQSIAGAIRERLAGPLYNQNCIIQSSKFDVPGEGRHVICIACDPGNESEPITLWKYTDEGWVKGENASQIAIGEGYWEDKVKLIIAFVDGDDTYTPGNPPLDADKSYLYYSPSHNKYYNYKITKDGDKYHFLGQEECGHCNYFYTLISIYVNCDDDLKDQFLSGKTDIEIPEEWKNKSDLSSIATKQLYYNFMESPYYKLDVFCREDPFKAEQLRDYTVLDVFSELTKRSDFIDVLEEEALHINEMVYMPENALMLMAILRQPSVQELLGDTSELAKDHPQINRFLERFDEIYYASKDIYEEHMLPESYGAFEYWLKGDEEPVDGVYYNEFYKVFVPKTDVVVFAKPDICSEKTTLSKDKVYHAQGSDRKNFILLTDSDGNGGFIYFERDKEYNNEMVLTANGIEKMADCFVYTDMVKEGSIAEGAEVVIDSITLTKEKAGDRFNSDLTVTVYSSPEVFEKALDTDFAWLTETERIMVAVNMDKMHTKGPVRVYYQRVNGDLYRNSVAYDEKNDRLVIMPIAEGDEEGTDRTEYVLWFGFCSEYREGESYSYPEIFYAK
ncbi:MAG: hypothetical protein IKN24_06235 [Lachnospiraceae bacterium]|nr:hypothetical protein [Lachnospiraceae bacterium]